MGKIKQFARSGVGELDASHLAMWNLLHRVEKHIKNRRWELVLENLEALIETTREHFEVEETLFQVHGVPEQEAHAKEHYDYVEQLFMFRKRCMRYTNINADELQIIFEQVANGMIDHINLKDYDAAAHIKRPT